MAKKPQRQIYSSTVQVRDNVVQLLGYDFAAIDITGSRLREQEESIALEIIEKRFDSPWGGRKKTTYLHYLHGCKARNGKPLSYRAFCSLITHSESYEARRQIKRDLVIQLAARIRRYVQEHGKRVRGSALWQRRYATFGSLHLSFSVKSTREGVLSKYFLSVWSEGKWGGACRTLLEISCEPLFDVFLLKKGDWIDEILALPE